MDNDYHKKEPDYLKGWQLFYDPITREFPLKTEEKFASSPDLPKDLAGENDFLGDRWEMLLLAKIHEGILGALTTQTETKSKTFEWRTVELLPTFARPKVYGDTADTATMMEKYFKGTLEGTAVGITMARGFQEQGVSTYTLWWNAQLAMALDTLERFAQGGIYNRILNNKDQLKEYINDHGKPINITVSEYLEKWKNPIINVFKKPHGWVRLNLFKDNYLDKFYKVRNQDEGPKSWVYLVARDVDNNVKLERPENIYFLYKGDKNLKSPQMSIYDYSTTVVFGDAVWVVPDFPVEDDILGKNILIKNQEFAKYYRFKPWNMLKKEKKSLEEYDIWISNDKEKKDEERIEYIDCLKNMDLKRIPSFFGINKTIKDVLTGNDRPTNWNDLLKETIVDKKEKNPGNLYQDDNNHLDPVIKPITKGYVKEWKHYFNHLISLLGIDDYIKTINSLYIDGKITFFDEQEHTEIVDKINFGKKPTKLLEEENIFGYSKYYKRMILRIKKLVGFLVKYCSIFDVLPGSVRIDMNKNEKKEMFFHSIITILLKDVIKHIDFDSKFASTVYPNITINPASKNLINEKVGDIEKMKIEDFLEKCFAKIELYKKDKDFGDQIMDFIENNFDVPFGVLALKRFVGSACDTFYVRKKSIEQKSMKMFVSTAQEYAGGNIHVTIHKTYGEKLGERRNVSKFENTFIKDCIYGGDNRIWKKSGGKKYPGKKAFTNGSLWLVPVTLNEVLCSRQPMINRTGFDKNDWRKTVSKVRLEENKQSFYYSTWKHMRSYYDWKHVIKKRNCSDYYFNSRIFKEDENHWAGFQRYVWDKSFESELGPNKGHHAWWTEVPVPIFVANKNNNIS